MSAIDNTFHFVRNPTAINGLATTYVSKRGSDGSGDGTEQNPFASLAKATSVATSGTNIMLDDGEWNELVTNNNRWYYLWGNAKTIISGNIFPFPHSSEYYCLHITFCNKIKEKSTIIFRKAKKCVFIYIRPYCNTNSSYYMEDCIFIFSELTSGGYSMGLGSVVKRCIFFGHPSARGLPTFENTFFYVENYTFPSNAGEYVNCNFSISDIPSNAQNSINNASTGQTLADYFNYVHPNVLANPTTASIDDWLQCDFTAKEGSANIGAGEKGTTIGLNQGFTMYADNSANDMFSPSNGATLKNIAWDSNLNGYALVQKERICQGATSNTITLDSSASAEDDYYNNLFVGIVGESVLGGGGYGEFFRIIDYDGATKTATIDGTWNVIPNTESVYTISGTILSAVKDLGKAIKVKRNWTFADNFTALTDGQWAEFMTHVETNGKQFPANCYSYEYSTDGVNFVQGQTADDLVSATNGENKVTDAIYGDCSPNYDEATAKNLIMRYIRVRVHIGFNIGQLGE